ncbi:MAG: hypothetical protein A2V45_16645 [Candidatus Aminicenantes bacterium RBG_19FT_COMBO_58_17]|nr:MAG: hypothetical protein A2V45_16645 [Candidatus Aminicenantes bacterium RBG_19FT_COMBO_58_17]
MSLSLIQALYAAGFQIIAASEGCQSEVSYSCIIAYDYLLLFLSAGFALVPHLCHIGSQMWAIRGKRRQNGQTSGQMSISLILVPYMGGIRWSQREGSNLRPADYEPTALAFQVTDK